MNIGNTLLASALLPLLAACAPAQFNSTDQSVLSLMQGPWPTMDNCTTLSGSASGLYNSRLSKSMVFGNHMITDITLSSDTNCAAPEVTYREVFELAIGNQGPNHAGHEVDWILTKSTITPITVAAAANFHSVSKCGTQDWFAHIENNVLLSAACNFDDSAQPLAVKHAPFMQRNLINAAFDGGTLKVYMGSPTGDPMVRPTCYAPLPALWR